ncbi:LacI family DNA-binding transcriptional regulator [Variovorax saccharolyticus]|uniref:LacI family DNA-binding transcriptional regulator n=1 Tax=Variovorax saccharolyticus TaxID=3053516 RepID=UPI0025756A98|nr:MULTISPECIES: LacI family DNA-binding transcriptional regulator [unclassified Variovorax]MDM0017592.1 LacI family DNA-binding transcriptional regulator [Variovorax sp. J22R187]MDM0028733.1 LacI family DNA-binding transcriptional regulator [Variovorax sp. J31P216]
MKPQPASTVTIRDVAQAAGVHVSTVSRALNPDKRGLISAEVLKVVEEAARKLGYRPNRAASALRTGRTHTIGVLVPDITNPVFPPILQGIEASAAARGYFVFVTNVVDPTLARPIVERMLAQRVDGLVLAIATRDDPLVDYIAKAGMQAVLVNRADESGRLPAVVSDDRLAMKLAVDHLVSLGHRRIGHLAGPQNVPTGVGRRQGVEQALRDRGLELACVEACEGYSREAGRVAMQKLLEGHERPEAVVCCNDLVALGAYDVLRAHGIRVPQDISITGHNDMPLVDMVNPPLTTIRLPHRELGWRAAEMLFEGIEGRVLSSFTVVLRPELVVRESTRDLAGEP